MPINLNNPSNNPAEIAAVAAIIVALITGTISIVTTIINQKSAKKSANANKEIQEKLRVFDQQIAINTHKIQTAYSNLFKEQFIAVQKLFELLTQLQTGWIAAVYVNQPFNDYEDKIIELSDYSDSVMVILPKTALDKLDDFKSLFFAINRKFVKVRAINMKMFKHQTDLQWHKELIEEVAFFTKIEFHQQTAIIRDEFKKLLGVNN